MGTTAATIDHVRLALQSIVEVKFVQMCKRDTSQHLSDAYDRWSVAVGARPRAEIWTASPDRAIVSTSVALLDDVEELSRCPGAALQYIVRKVLQACAVALRWETASSVIISGEIWSRMTPALKNGDREVLSSLIMVIGMQPAMRGIRRTELLQEMLLQRRRDVQWRSLFMA